MNNKYAKAYTEVIEIISHFSDEEYSRIPKEKIEYYEENRDKNYIFKLEPNVDLSEQNISREANAILVSLYRDYFASETEKQKINTVLNINQQKLEEEKREKYNPEKLFENNKEDNKEEVKEELALIEVKNENWYEKILMFLQRLFKK